MFRQPYEGKVIISSEKKIIDVEGIKLKYALFSPLKPVTPIERRGIQIRFKNVAIGNPQNFDLNIQSRLSIKSHILKLWKFG